MKELIQIQAYNRYEFLALCLENVYKADGPIPDIHVVVDNHKGAPPAEDVIDLLKMLSQEPNYRLTYKVLEPHSYPGLSYAVTSGMILSLHHPVQWSHLYYIEDDIMVGKDFFRWHREMAESRKYFATVGCKNHCEGAEKHKCREPYHFYESGHDYNSLGVCFPRASVMKIVQHAKHDYWKDTTAYVQKHWPKSKIAAMYSEQAGMTRRLVEADPEHIVGWPCAPRCFHLGWYGKNCKGEPIPGTTKEERLNNLRTFMFDKKKLNQMAKSHKFMDPCPLDGHKWDKLVKHS